MTATEQEITPAQRKRIAKTSRAAWDECWSRLIESAKNWRLAAFVSFGLTGLSICYMGHLGSLPKQVVIPIEVDKQGHVTNVKNFQDEPLTPKMWDEIYTTQLESFVTDWRTVTSDKSAQDADWDRAYSYLGGSSQAKAFLDSWYMQNNPASKLQDNTIVRVHFDTHDREGDSTYGIWWTEIATSLTGELKSTKRWHCVFTFVKKDLTNFRITEIRLEEVHA